MMRLSSSSPSLGQAPSAGQSLGRRYTSLEVARALAALAVVMVHSESIAAAMSGRAYAHGLWQFGQAGVDLFFVISGFVIAMVVARAEPASRFVMHRVARILPFYWFFTAAWLATMALQGHPLPLLGDVTVSLAMLPQAPMPVLGVGWSLEHEILFYAVAALLLLCGRQDALLRVMAVLAAVSVALNFAVPAGIGHALPDHLLTLYNVQFVIGVAMFRWRSTLARLPWRRLLICGALFFPGAAAVLHLVYQTTIPAQPHGLPGLLRVLSWGGAAALVLGSLLALEAQRPDLLRSARARALIGIGRASFTLYLLHSILFALVGSLLANTGAAGWSTLLVQGIASMAAVGASLVFYRLAEEPLLGWLRGRLPLRSAPTCRITLPQAS